MFGVDSLFASTEGSEKQYRWGEKSILIEKEGSLESFSFLYSLLDFPLYSREPKSK